MCHTGGSHIYRSLIAGRNEHEMSTSVAGVQAARIESNTPHTRRKHRRAKSGSKIEANGDGNGTLSRICTDRQPAVFVSLIHCCAHYLSPQIIAVTVLPVI